MKDTDLKGKPKEDLVLDVVIMVDTMEVIMEATIVHIGLDLHLGVLDLDFTLVLPVLEFLLVEAGTEAVMEAAMEALVEDFMAKNNELLCANNKSGLVYGLYITTKHSSSAMCIIYTAHFSSQHQQCFPRFGYLDGYMTRETILMQKRIDLF